MTILSLTRAGAIEEVGEEAAEASVVVATPSPLVKATSK
jgi:hypothetical protein